VVAVPMGGCCGCGFIVKNAIARTRNPIQINSSPMRTIVRTAPINKSNPAVENHPTDVFEETILRDRLSKNIVIIANIHRIARTAIAPTMNGTMSEKLMLLVFGVMPDRDERLDQLPSQLG